MELRNKLFWFAIVPCFLFAVYLLCSNFCFADEKTELQFKEALYNEMLQNVQLKAYYAQNELKIVQSKLQVLERQEEEKRKLTIDNEINKLKEPKKDKLRNDHKGID